MKQVDRSAGRDVGQRIEVTGNVRRIGEEPVYGNQSRYSWEDGQQEIEGHPGGDQRDAVFRNTVEDTQEDVLPPFGRDLRRCVGGSAAARFRRRAIFGPGCFRGGPALAETYGEQQRGKRDGPQGGGLGPAKRDI